MADEQEQEHRESHARLVALKVTSVAAQAKATADGYSREAWDGWRAAAEECQAAVTWHAQRFGLNRHDVERAIMAEVLHPEPKE
ncbi:hypothetical protein [Streptomyces sp. NPDC050856]|uniref:hypothetical protein n=1 Tax=Streptomyces sp. NPDC050856 TaxID=3154939 RepID=UPI0033EF1D50